MKKRKYTISEKVKAKNLAFTKVERNKRIMSLFNFGMKKSDIARELGISKQRVDYLVKKYQKINEENGS